MNTVEFTSRIEPTAFRVYCYRHSLQCLRDPLMAVIVDTDAVLDRSWPPEISRSLKGKGFSLDEAVESPWTAPILRDTPNCDIHRMPDLFLTFPAPRSWGSTTARWGDLRRGAFGHAMHGSLFYILCPSFSRSWDAQRFVNVENFVANNIVGCDCQVNLRQMTASQDVFVRVREGNIANCKG